jgi:hypothetical protein
LESLDFVQGSEKRPLEVAFISSHRAQDGRFQEHPATVFPLQEQLPKPSFLDKFTPSRFSLVALLVKRGDASIP